MFQTYMPSGKIGVLTWPFLLLGSVLAIGLAFVYQYLLDWIPLIYVNFLLTWGLGIALGKVGIWVVRNGSLRNVMVAAILGILIVSTAISAKFCFQYSSRLDMETQLKIETIGAGDEQYDKIRQEIATHLDFGTYIKDRANDGFTIGRGGGGLPLTGIFVYVIWLIEFGLVAWFGISMPCSAAGLPYSEKQSAWASEVETVMNLPVTDPDMVAKIKAATSVEDLLQIPIPKTDVSTKFAVYRVNSIPGQELEDAYLSVDLVSFTTNSNGESETTTDSLVRHAILTSNNRNQLVENASLLQEAMAAYRESIGSEQHSGDEANGSDNDGPAVS